MKWYIKVVRENYFNFTGRAGRKEYWMFYLFHILFILAAIFIDVVENTSGDKWKIGTIERMQFYKEAKEAFVIVSTTDARAFGCFILTKGVIKPDGSVW